MLKGILKLQARMDAICAGCQYGKAHQFRYEDSKYTAKEPLKLIHLDLLWPFKKLSVGVMKYMLTFINHFSGYMWIYF